MIRSQIPAHTRVLEYVYRIECSVLKVLCSFMKDPRPHQLYFQVIHVNGTVTSIPLMSFALWGLYLIFFSLSTHFTVKSAVALVIHSLCLSEGKYMALVTVDKHCSFMDLVSLCIFVLPLFIIVH